MPLMITNPIPGKRREMNICLTEKGKIYAKQLLDVIYRAENHAIKELVQRYCDTRSAGWNQPAANTRYDALYEYCSH